MTGVQFVVRVEFDGGRGWVELPCCGMGETVAELVQRLEGAYEAKYGARPLLRRLADAAGGTLHGERLIASAMPPDARTAHAVVASWASVPPPAARYAAVVAHGPASADGADLAPVGHRATGIRAALAAAMVAAGDPAVLECNAQGINSSEADLLGRVLLHWSSLRALKLADNPIGDAGAAALAAALHCLPALEELDLTAAALGSAGCAAVLSPPRIAAAARPYGALAVLRLAHNGMDAVEQGPYASLLRTAPLRELDLAGCGVRAECVALALTRLPSDRKACLATLRLAGCSMPCPPDRGLPLLACGPAALDLGGAEFVSGAEGRDWGTAVPPAIDAPPPLALSFCGTLSSSRLVECLGSLRPKMHLTALDLRHCALGSSTLKSALAAIGTGAPALAELLCVPVAQPPRGLAPADPRQA